MLFQVDDAVDLILLQVLDSVAFTPFQTVEVFALMLFQPLLTVVFRFVQVDDAVVLMLVQAEDSPLLIPFHALVVPDLMALQAFEIPVLTVLQADDTPDLMPFHALLITPLIPVHAVVAVDLILLHALLKKVFNFSITPEKKSVILCQALEMPCFSPSIRNVPISANTVDGEWRPNRFFHQSQQGLRGFFAATNPRRALRLRFHERNRR